MCAHFVEQNSTMQSSKSTNSVEAKKLISAAQMYALKSISIKDVCLLLNCKEEDIPVSFYTYAEVYGMKYDLYLGLKELKALVNNQK